MTRVLLTGMGGELGSRVAALLEAEPWVDELVGCDVDPPPRRLRRALFHRLDPRDRRKVLALVGEVRPTVVVHLGVYEPDAGSSPRVAAERTAAGTLSVLGRAAETGELERIVLRSGIEVYGRRLGAAAVPDESVPPDPTSLFGRVLLDAERVAVAAGRSADVPVVAVRLATVAAPHGSSPLGRLLRLPVVPFAALADPAFSLVHQDDAARALVAAVRADVDGPVNVGGTGAVTAAQAARLGGRVPLPVAGPGWPAVRRLAELAGTPIPDHVVELLRRGRAADVRSASHLLGPAPAWATVDVVKALHGWAPVTPLSAAGEAAA